MRTDDHRGTLDDTGSLGKLGFVTGLRAPSNRRSKAKKYQDQRPKLKQKRHPAPPVTGSRSPARTLDGKDSYQKGLLSSEDGQEARKKKNPCQRMIWERYACRRSVER